MDEITHSFLLSKDLDLDKFEELFKTKAQGPAIDLLCSKNKASHKAVNKVTLLEANRAKNLAITLRKAGRTTEEICKAIHTWVSLCVPFPILWFSFSRRQPFSLSGIVFLQA